MKYLLRKRESKEVGEVILEQQQGLLQVRSHTPKTRAVRMVACCSPARFSCSGAGWEK